MVVIEAIQIINIINNKCLYFTFTYTISEAHSWQFILYFPSSNEHYHE